MFHYATMSTNIYSNSKALSKTGDFSYSIHCLNGVAAICLKMHWEQAVTMKIQQ